MDGSNRESGIWDAAHTSDPSLILRPPSVHPGKAGEGCRKQRVAGTESFEKDAQWRFPAGPSDLFDKGTLGPPAVRAPPTPPHLHLRRVFRVTNENKGGCLPR